MKKWIILTTLASILALSVVAFAEPGERRDSDDPRGIRGPLRPQPMQPHPGMMLERVLSNPNTAERLDLSEDQMASLKALKLQTARETIPLRAEAELATLELREALSAETPDEAIVMSAIDRVHKAKAELQKAEVRSRLASRTILGPEARKKIETFMRDRMQKQKQMQMRGRDLPTASRPDRPDRPMRPDAPDRPMRPDAVTPVRPRR